MRYAIESVKDKGLKKIKRMIEGSELPDNPASVAQIAETSTCCEKASQRWRDWRLEKGPESDVVKAAAQRRP